LRVKGIYQSPVGHGIREGNVMVRHINQSP
jgi:hypothetical protein